MLGDDEGSRPECLDESVSDDVSLRGEGLHRRPAVVQATLEDRHGAYHEPETRRGPGHHGCDGRQAAQERYEEGRRCHYRDGEEIGSRGRLDQHTGHLAGHHAAGIRRPTGGAVEVSQVPDGCPETPAAPEGQTADLDVDLVPDCRQPRRQRRELGGGGGEASEVDPDLELGAHLCPDPGVGASVVLQALFSPLRAPQVEEAARGQVTGADDNLQYADANGPWSDHARRSGRRARMRPSGPQRTDLGLRRSARLLLSRTLKS